MFLFCCGGSCIASFLFKCYTGISLSTRNQYSLNAMFDYFFVMYQCIPYTGNLVEIYSRLIFPPIWCSNLLSPIKEAQKNWEGTYVHILCIFVHAEGSKKKIPEVRPVAPMNWSIMLNLLSILNSMILRKSSPTNKGYTFWNILCYLIFYS